MSNQREPREIYNTYDRNYIRGIQRNGRKILTKLQVLTHDELVFKEVIDDFVVDSDNISFTYNQGVQGKCSFNIKNERNQYTPNDKIEDSYFWFGRKVRIFKGIQDISGDNIYWWSLGVWIITEVSNQDKIIHISCVDKFGMFTNDTGFSLLHLSSKIEGDHVLHDVVRTLLKKDMGNSSILDPQEPIFDSNVINRMINNDIEMTSGSHIGDHFIELANLARCRIFYDRFGHLRFQGGTLDAFFSTQAPVWDFDDEFSNEYIRASRNFDFTKMVNQVTIWGEDFKGRYHRATRENRNPNSPARIDLIGRRVAPPIPTMYGYEQENVDAFAEFWLETRSIQGIRIPVTSVLIPHLQVRDVVTLNHEYFKYKNRRFLVNELTINGALMTISLVAVDSLPFHVELQ